MEAPNFAGAHFNNYFPRPTPPPGAQRHPSSSRDWVGLYVSCRILSCICKAIDMVVCVDNLARKQLPFLYSGDVFVVDMYLTDRLMAVVGTSHHSGWLCSPLAAWWWFSNPFYYIGLCFRFTSRSPRATFIHCKLFRWKKKELYQ